ncbi:hypothetical protein BJ322DRAFT_1111610 [Thelephora terrestris]|uniref:Uncharacterized protein n=1 Tax=Thelephora terrestris TaxID=56493 RepID=A0A9P6H8C9_9AGAM|nr:hypothetical protein BJ322DRAFT_1111610 [Thelephora terrestris]
MSSSSKWTPPAAASDPIILAAMIQSAKAVKIPDDEKHPDWARPTIKALVSAQGRPEAFEPVWATVLPFWRLKGLEERLEGDKELRDPWAMHALAWLARHRDVCRSFGLPPLQLIVDWADAAESIGWLTPGSTPFGEDAEEAPAPVISRQSTLRPVGSAGGATTPAMSRQPSIQAVRGTVGDLPPPTSREPSIQPTPQVSERDEDFEMEDTPRRSAGGGRNTTGGKSALIPYVAVPPRPQATRRDVSATESNVGLKRDLSSSPSKEESTSKRSRTTGTTGKGKGVQRDHVPAFPAIDLSGETYEEGEQLNTVKFPGARKYVSLLNLSRCIREVSYFFQTCDRCDSSSSKVVKDACRPTWCLALKEERPTFICAACRKDKKGCSFKWMTFGITGWPTVTRTPAGDRRRRKEAADRRKTEVPTNELADDGGKVPKPKRAPRVRKAATSAASEPSPSVSTRSKTKAATASSNVALPTVAMAGLSVGGPSSGLHSWEVDLREFEQEWGPSTDSPVAVEQLRAALRSQLAKERNEVDEIADLVASRRYIAKRILARMNEEINRRGGEEIWDSSDFACSGEEGGDGDVSVGAVSDDEVFSDGGAAVRDVGEELRDVDDVEDSGMVAEGSRRV